MNVKCKQTREHDPQLWRHSVITAFKPSSVGFVSHYLYICIYGIWYIGDVVFEGKQMARWQL